MPSSAPMPYQDEDQDSATLKWIVLFVALSLVAHALLLLILIFLSKHIPPPRLEAATVTPTTSITLIQPPPQAAPKHIFMTTPNDQKNVPHKDTLVESDHDTQVASKSKTGRKPDSVMPDVVSKDSHASSLQASPAAPPTPKAQTQTTPPSPKQPEAKPEPPKPPEPQQPPEPKGEKTPPNPVKTEPPPKPAPTPPKTPPPPQVDENGLPVLPALSAPTLAPQTSANTAQPQQVASTTPMAPIVPMNVQGRAGMSGQPSPEAMKTDLGQYKARFYQAVGSRWYAKVAQQMQLIGVGAVRVQYTITPDGVITTKVLDGGNGSMQILLTISVSSIRECSPFLQFPPSMLKDYPNGYTDDFSFSVY